MEQLTLDSHPSMKNLVCHQLCIPVAEPQQKDRPPVITTAGCINQGQPGLSPNSQQREGEKEGEEEKETVCHFVCVYVCVCLFVDVCVYLCVSVCLHVCL